MAYTTLECEIASRMNCSVDDVWLHDVPDDIYEDAMNATELIDELLLLGIPLEQAECLDRSWDAMAFDWGSTSYRRDQLVSRLLADESF